MAASTVATLAVLALNLLTTPVLAQSPSAEDEASVREFQLTYSGTIKGLPANSKVRVWLPLAVTDEHQEVVQTKSQLPSIGKEKQESVHGNQMVYFELSPAKEMDAPFMLQYQVKRSEVNALGRDHKDDLVEELKQRYLAANLMVPLTGKPAELLKDKKVPNEPVAAAQFLYNLVDDQMTYDKSNTGYGNGDVLWACDSKTGNCTDFHSVFISFARQQNLPARFEIGFPLPTERGEGEIGGYHCWANFYVSGKGWVPVDISEADKHPEMKEYYFGNLTENRVSLTRGRDIDLNPKQDGPALNYFVYPYVEVNGEVWPKEKIELALGYKDAQ